MGVTSRRRISIETGAGWFAARIASNDATASPILDEFAVIDRPLYERRTRACGNLLM
jgi:hypothetical protein